jgi:hypothetical protein
MIYVVTENCIRCKQRLLSHAWTRHTQQVIYRVFVIGNVGWQATRIGGNIGMKHLPDPNAGSRLAAQIVS